MTAVNKHRFATVTLHGYDLSPIMLQQAKVRLVAFDERFVPRRFNLAENEWRTAVPTFHAVQRSNRRPIFCASAFNL